MYRMREWSVRHASALSRIYAWLESLLVRLDPLWRTIGHERLEKPFAAVERTVKGFLFDCQMCGDCVLSSTGMSCPMNCPKHLRNGPCGGVRENGNCEVIPAMKCVWVAAYEGSQNIPGGVEDMRVIQIAVDRRLSGTSSWLRVVRDKTGAGP